MNDYDKTAYELVSNTLKLCLDYLRDALHAAEMNRDAHQVAIIRSFIESTAAKVAALEKMAGIEP